jgi:hypothetical protein
MFLRKTKRNFDYFVFPVCGKTVQVVGLGIEITNHLTTNHTTHKTIPHYFDILRVLVLSSYGILLFTFQPIPTRI